MQELVDSPTAGRQRRPIGVCLMLSLPLSVFLLVAGRPAERAAVWVAAALMVVAATAHLCCAREGRANVRLHWFVTVAAGLMVASLVAVAVHLLNDHFSYRYVWLYSAAELPWYLKLANLWGGDEGTLALMGALLMLGAARALRYDGWAFAGAALLGAAFAAGAGVWSPFEATPAADLTRMNGQGINAHLATIWMAIHPPLVFIAFALVLAPVGAAFEALVRGTGGWRDIIGRYTRLAWLILTIGLATGMWWAYEDHTFGQFWHWDPVQTAVFVVWALLTAQVHGLRHYRANGFLGRLLPALSLVGASAVLAAMAVTRSETLASSHRYVGDTSLPVLLGLSLAMGALTVCGWLIARGRAVCKPAGFSETRFMVCVAVALFASMAIVGAAYIAQAYISAFASLPRPESLKPFFETLGRWAAPGEVARLREVFAQWDVDNFAVNRWLAPIACVLGLLGGHAFLPLSNRRAAWGVTAVVAAAIVVLAVYFEPFSDRYDGTGLTSKHTVQIFFWLDVMVLSAIYLIGAAALWLIRLTPRLRRARVRWYFAPVGLTHLAAMIALVGAVSASVLDSYGQKQIRFPQEFGQFHRFPDGYRLQIELGQQGKRRDGAFTAGADAYQAITNVTLALEQDERLLPVGEGQTLYRDGRSVPSTSGPVRQLCEMVDYRYARYAGDPAYSLDPFIHRGFWRDVQIWVPGANFSNTGAPQDVSVVIKTFPLLSWLWLGLGGVVVAGTVITAGAWFQRRRLNEL